MGWLKILIFNLFIKKLELIPKSISFVVMNLFVQHQRPEPRHLEQCSAGQAVYEVDP